jgi:hypothetical protein
MKHITNLFLLCVIVAHTSPAQNPITIQQSTMQSIFTVSNPIRIYASSTTQPSVNVGQRGGPNLYDFSSLNFSVVILDTFRQVSTIPYLAFRFPGTALTLNLIDNPSLKNHVLFLWDNNRLLTPGDYLEFSADSFLVTQSNPPELFLKFPMYYPDSTGGTSRITRSFYSRGTLAGSEQHDIPIHYIVDGYGTLRLPGGETRPCLRLTWYEQPPNYHYKSFRYITDNGMILVVDTQNDQPDEGMVQLDDRVILFRNSPLTTVPETTMPSQFSLSQNYPNPFNPSTKFEFQIPRGGLVTLRVFDLRGREAAIVVHEELNAGLHQFEWNANGLPSGMYLYRLEAGQWIETKKLVLIK